MLYQRLKFVLIVFSLLAINPLTGYSQTPPFPEGFQVSFQNESVASVITAKVSATDSLLYLVSDIYVHPRITLLKSDSTGAFAPFSEINLPDPVSPTIVYPWVLSTTLFDTDPTTIEFIATDGVDKVYLMQAPYRSSTTTLSASILNTWGDSNVYAQIEGGSAGDQSTLGPIVCARNPSGAKVYYLKIALIPKDGSPVLDKQVILYTLPGTFPDANAIPC